MTSENNDRDLKVIRYQVIAAGLSFGSLIAFGTIMFHILERWTWASSFYFSVVTLATVGYGDLVPSKDVTRVFTAIFILFGATIALAAAAVIGSRYLELRGVKVEERRERRKLHK
jgi:voltage-gated potassium channel